MSEEIDGQVVDTNTDTQTPEVEATAAAAAFDIARGAEPAEVASEEHVVETPKLFAGKTEEELTALLNEIPTMKDGFRRQIDNLAGNHGSLKAAFQRLQQDTPSGQAVELDDEDFAEMQSEFPELADMTKKALGSVLKRINLRGSAAIDPTMIDERVNKLVSERVSNERVSIHKEILDGTAPDWQTVVGVPDEAKMLQLIRAGKSQEEALAESLPKTEYRAWLATQPQGYQERIGSSNNAFEISASISKFREAQEQVVKKQEQSKQRLANAVQPQGSVAVRPAVSEQQAAEEAFKKSRSG